MKQLKCFKITEIISAHRTQGKLALAVYLQCHRPCVYVIQGMCRMITLLIHT